MPTPVIENTLTTSLLLLLHFQNTNIFVGGTQFIITNGNYLNTSPWSSKWHRWWWCIEQWLALPDRMEYPQSHRLKGSEPYRLLAILLVLPASNQPTPGRPAPSAMDEYTDLLKRKCRHLDAIINTGSEFLIFCHVFKKWFLFHWYQLMTGRLFHTMHLSSHMETGTKWPPFFRRCFHMHFVYENVHISIKISLKVVPKGPIINIHTLIQTMAWRRPGDKPLSKPIVVNLLTHLSVTRPQWVNWFRFVAKTKASSWATYKLSCRLRKIPS